MYSDHSECSGVLGLRHRHTLRCPSHDAHGRPRIITAAECHGQRRSSYRVAQHTTHLGEIACTKRPMRVHDQSISLPPSQIARIYFSTRGRFSGCAISALTSRLGTHPPLLGQWEVPIFSNTVPIFSNAVAIFSNPGYWVGALETHPPLG